MPRRPAITLASSLAITVGVVFLAFPDIPCMLLLGAKPEGSNIPLARLAGLWSVALGIVCLLATSPGSRRKAAIGLFTFNLGVAILLIAQGFEPAPHGFLLWPLAILHAVIAAALLPTILEAWITGSGA